MFIYLKKDSVHIMVQNRIVEAIFFFRKNLFKRSHYDYSLPQQFAMLNKSTNVTITEC